MVQKLEHLSREYSEKMSIDLVWCISLIVIGLATFILAGTNIVGIELPDVAVRILGIVDLLALPFF